MNSKGHISIAYLFMMLIVFQTSAYVFKLHQFKEEVLNHYSRSMRTNKGSILLIEALWCVLFIMTVQIASTHFSDEVKDVSHEISRITKG